MTLLEYLFHLFHGEKSKRSLKALIEKGACLVNGKKELFASTKIHSKDKVQLLFKEVQKQKPASLLFEDDFFAVLNKPPGMLSSKTPWGEPLHRLDKGTSGLLLVSKEKNSKPLFEELFKNHEIKKTYLALVRGIPKTPSGHIDLPLKETKEHGKIFVAIAKRGLEAKTNWKLLRKLNRIALLECMPITGRTHQIRVHLKAIGHPILGDPIYASSVPFPSDRPLLHAWKLSFLHPMTKEKMSFKAPLPDDMKKIIGDLN